MTNNEKITNNEVYKKVLADSFGGVMYNAANRGTYDAGELIELWDGMSQFDLSRFS